MWKEVMGDVSAFGGLPLYAIVALIFLFVGEVNVFLFLVLGLVLIYAVASTIRLVKFKVRPDKQKYKNWLQKIDASSFPSLHSARAAFLTLVVFWYYKNLALLLILIAVMLGVGYARVWLDRHYIKDVIAGYVLGIAVFFLLGLL
jgi:membrane-associated phospholipid phosphatase